MFFTFLFSEDRFVASCSFFLMSWWCRWFACGAAVVDLPFIEFRSMHYSSLSGMVATVSVGAPRQDILVALDSSIEHSFIYDKYACPPFVGRCFDPMRSNDGWFGQGIRTTLSEDYARFDGYPTSGLFDGIYEFHFILVDSVSPKTGRFRDVAGAISLSKSSLFFINNQVAIRDDSARVLIPGEMNEASRIFVPSHTQTNLWKFNVVIRFNNIRNLGSTLEYDPGESDILIPVDRGHIILRSTQDEAAHLNWDGRLVMSCHLIPSFTIEFTNANPSRLVEIPTELLVVRGSENQGLCSTRFRFAETVDHIVIGRALTRTLIEVILDFDNGGILFQRPRAAASIARYHKSYSTPFPLIPLFELDYSAAGSNVIRLVRVEARNAFGLIFAGDGSKLIKSHSWIELAEFSQITCGQKVDINCRSQDLIEYHFEAGDSFTGEVKDVGDAVHILVTEKVFVTTTSPLPEEPMTTTTSTTTTMTPHEETLEDNKPRISRRVSFALSKNTYSYINDSPSTT
jgi:hypothetical protein